jgi:peptide/nickel transport system substrate-binding protein
MGALMEVEAFDSHALGRPRIERVRLHFTNDPNTVLATLLADAAHMATTDTIDLEQAAVLERDWVSTQRGVIVRSPVGVRHGNFQLRPEQARPVLLDLRVRKAIVHATNREVLAESLTEGQATIAHALLLPQVEYFAELDRAITKYPYDLRRVEQLFGAAGFSKGTDGFYASPGEGRFSLEVAVAAGARNDKEVAIMADYLRQAGIDASVRVIPRAQIADRQLRLSLTGILNGSFGRAFLPPIQRLRASEIPGPENRWQGSNQSGWSHPEVERLITSYETTLDRVERTQHVIEMMTLVSEEVPIFGLYYNLSFLAHAASLRGPSPYVSDDVANWNIHEWHWAF